MGIFEQWRQRVSRALRIKRPLEGGAEPTPHQVARAILVERLREIPSSPDLPAGWAAAHRLALLELEGILAPGAATRPHPLTVAVVGVTQSGKSTLVNALAGARVASEDPRPRATTIPQAIAPGGEGASWSGNFPAPAGGYVISADPDGARRGYGPVPVDASGDRILLTEADIRGTGGAVLLDLPDFDSGTPQHRRRALELACLCDAVIMVTSEERYASDEVPRFRESVGAVGHEWFWVGNRVTDPAVEEHMRETLGAPPDRFAALPEGREALAEAPGVAAIRAFLKDLGRERHALRARRRAAVIANLPLRMRPVIEPLEKAAAGYEVQREIWRLEAERQRERFREELLARRDFPELEAALDRWLSKFDLPGYTKGMRQARGWIGRRARTVLARFGWVGPVRERGDFRTSASAIVAFAFENQLSAVGRQLTEADPDAASRFLEHVDRPEVRSSLERVREETSTLLIELAESTIRMLETEVASIRGWKKGTLIVLRHALDVGIPVGAIALTGGVGMEDLVLGPASAAAMNWASDFLLDRTFLQRARAGMISAQATALREGLGRAFEESLGPVLAPPVSSRTLEGIRDSVASLYRPERERA